MNTTTTVTARSYPVAAPYREGQEPSYYLAAYDELVTEARRLDAITEPFQQHVDEAAALRELANDLRAVSDPVLGPVPEFKAGEEAHSEILGAVTRIMRRTITADADRLLSTEDVDTMRGVLTVRKYPDHIQIVADDGTRDYLTHGEAAELARVLTEQP